ncbi:MAG: serine dehydratase [Bacteroidetes bacterium HGW-Bacteroidetes-1]|jgi:threonine dehydratase|nr:MAG: serine dehydratase [Bacteroidetes bacterium HGW-Bacteroidetes-1]
MKLQNVPTLADIRNALEVIQPFIHKTPLLQSEQLNQLAQSALFFKCENFQKAGAFKSRGAMHALLSLDANELRRGVATHSSGNHAQALARAAMILKTDAHIVMPETAPSVKVAAVKQYGGKITFCKPTLEARESTLEAVMLKTGAELVHPYNDYTIIAGQATACLEMLQQMPSPDYVLCPVGGGGLLSGTLLTIKYLSPKTKVIACEPSGANDTWQSFKTGKLVPSLHPHTIADGLLTSLGSLTYPIIMENIDDVVTVDDNSIIDAMKLVWERMKIIIEPSSAVPVAVALSGLSFLKGKKAGIILSGGNIDLNKIPWL